jgi:hypothetical protein
MVHDNTPIAKPFVCKLAIQEIPRLNDNHYPKELSETATKPNKGQGTPIIPDDLKYSTVRTAAKNA